MQSTTKSTLMFSVLLLGFSSFSFAADQPMPANISNATLIQYDAATPPFAMSKLNCDDGRECFNKPSLRDLLPPPTRPAPPLSKMPPPPAMLCDQGKTCAPPSPMRPLPPNLHGKPMPPHAHGAAPIHPPVIDGFKPLTPRGGVTNWPGVEHPVRQ